MQERTEGQQVPKIEQRAADYNLTEHCNLRCAGCDHSSPLLAKKFAEVAEYQRDLAALSQVLHLRELKILGGEPLLHPDLIEFLRGARASGIADEITWSPEEAASEGPVREKSVSKRTDVGPRAVQGRSNPAHLRRQEPVVVTSRIAT